MVDQHSQIKQCSTQIDHAQALNEVLRQVDHFLRLMTRLDTEIAAGPAEYAKTAIHIYELGNYVFLSSLLSMRFGTAV